MARLHISGKFKWMLVLGLALFLLTSFSACSDGPTGVQIIGEDEEEDNDNDNNPDDPGTNYSLIFDIQGLITEYS